MKSSTRLASEFILIIVGVLIALMIEAAFEEREHANLGDEYKDRLRNDLMLDKLAIERRIEFFTDVKRFSEETLEWLNSDREVDSDILLAAYYAAEVWPFLPDRSTYEDLQNTGNIRLLDDIDYSRMARFFSPLQDSSELRRILTYRNSELDVMIYLLGQQGTFADRVLGFLPAVSQ